MNLISERYYHDNIQFRSFDTSWDLTVKRPSAYWTEAQNRGVL